MRKYSVSLQQWHDREIDKPDKTGLNWFKLDKTEKTEKNWKKMDQTGSNWLKLEKMEKPEKSKNKFNIKNWKKINK